MTACLVDDCRLVVAEGAPEAAVPTARSWSAGDTARLAPVSVMPKTSYHGAPQRSSIAACWSTGIAEQKTRSTALVSCSAGGCFISRVGITPRQ